MVSSFYSKELDSVKSHIIDSSILRKELKNYLIIRQVTIIESYLKYHVIRIIDDYQLDIISLFDNKEFLVSIHNIDYIKKKDFTKGRIVATNFNFQNPNDINFVFSKLLQVDFFSLLREILAMKMFTKSTRFSKKTNQLLKYWDEFIEIFEIRNEIIHSVKKTENQKKNLDYYNRIYENVPLFIITCVSFSELVLQFKKGESINKDFKKIISEKLIEYKTRNK